MALGGVEARAIATKLFERGWISVLRRFLCASPSTTRKPSADWKRHEEAGPALKRWAFICRARGADITRSVAPRVALCDSPLEDCEMFRVRHGRVTSLAS